MDDQGVRALSEAFFQTLSSSLVSYFGEYITAFEKTVAAVY